MESRQISAAALVEEEEEEVDEVDEVDEVKEEEEVEEENEEEEAGRRRRLSPRHLLLRINNGC